MSKRIFLAMACTGLLTGGLGGSATAYDLKPMVIQIKASGAGSAATAIITNTHPVPIAIEIRAYKREQQSDGTERLTPEDSDIILTPPQMVIAPKASQSFKIQWVGDPKPYRELAYRIVTDQLPIQLSKTSRNDRTADITMKYRYEMALYVQPEGMKPAADIVSVEPAAGPEGRRQLAVRVRSSGGMRAVLDKPVLQLRGADNRPITLEGDAVKELIGLNILPGVERVVRIAAPDGLPAGKLTGSLSTEYIVLR
ncbi:fimbria/pilus periplasmic chaperone [Sphingomonas hylomeconis]|uniref:Fimbria/pilus periplasmic chaperone n=1 Tax=Sphingomonas hylomeconis TaxID=1395958 RepID=A0ABV7SWM2_9SPHN|nr:fimbria/pilus periplasmic chaperone [Sphingomonas hylomeconis]